VLLAAIVPIRLVNYLNGNQLVAHGYQSVRVSRIGLTALFAVVAGAVAIHLGGYDGAAIITLAAEAVLFALYLMAVRKRVGPEAALYPIAPAKGTE
jgi:O-antigen/teichoic acid export membrane protein